MSPQVHRALTWAAGPLCQKNAGAPAVLIAFVSRDGPVSHPASSTPAKLTLSSTELAQLNPALPGAPTHPLPARQRPLQMPAYPPLLRQGLPPALPQQPLASIQQRPAFGRSVSSSASLSSSCAGESSHRLDSTSPSTPSPSCTSPSSSSSPAEPRPNPNSPADSAGVASTATPSTLTTSTGSAASPPPASPSSSSPLPKGPRPPPTPTPPTPTAAQAAGGAHLVLRARGRSARASLDAAGASLLAAAVDLGAKLNRVTGYDTIEQLKLKVDEANRRLADAREELRESKAAFEARAAEQGDVQRQQMSLLQRKSSWQGADLERFTELCRQEHHLEAEVVQAKAAYGEAAEALEACHDAVAAAVRERYSAETLWSDKIRRASTWWTAGLVGLNLVSFLSVYLVMEPIKARRLRSHVEEVLRQEMAHVRQSLASLEASLHPPQAAGPASQVAAAAPLAAATAATAGLVAEGSRGGGGDGAGEADGVVGAHLVSGLLEQVRRVKTHVAAVERGLAGVLEQGRAPHAAAGTSLPLAQLPSSGGAGPMAVGVEGPRAEETPGDFAEGSQEPGTVQVRAPETRAWHLRLCERLYRIAVRPEVTTAAAAFTGAALGVGLLLALRD